MIRQKILEAYRKAVPPISQTEKEALESGTVGWEGEIFKGKPDWQKLLDLPEAKLTEKEQAFMDGPVQKLCDMLDNWELNNIDNGYGDLPKPIWDFLKKEKFLGMVVPEEYEGLGFSAYAHSQVVMKIASRSITTAVTVMVPNSLGPAELLHEYGTKEQKDHYLPRLAKGLEVPCFALTGPDNGSDAGAMPDVGIVCKDEDGNLGIKINWDKRYITLGPVATLIGMAFKLKDPDGLLGDEKDIGITVALVPRDTKGVTIGNRHRPMDIPFQNGPNQGKDVFIPLDAVIGGKEGVGKGWRMLMESLSVGRSISLPSLSTAGSKLATQTTSAYGMVRKQFSTSLSKFEGVEESLAAIAGRTYMMDAARTATIQMVDRGEKPAVLSAISKYHLTENMRKSINDAMDIHGGKAISNGPRNLLADTYKGIPVAITVEGANIMTRNLIIFGQGAVRSHEYMLKEMHAAAKPDAEARKELTTLLMGHIGSVITNGARSLWLGLTNGLTSHVPVKGKETKRYYQQVNRLCSSFNFVANTTLLLLGGALKRKERVSARLGDALSHIYIAATTLRHFEMQGRQSDDVPLMQWAMEHSLHEAEKSMHDLLDNYPNKFVGGLLRAVMFPRSLLPFSSRFKNKGPSDKLDHLVVKSISTPNEARDRLIDGVYSTQKENEQIFILEKAFKKVTEAEPLEKKIYQAVKSGELETRDLKTAVEKDILTQEEADLIIEATALRSEIVKVDDFAQKAQKQTSKPKKKAVKKQTPTAKKPKK